MKICAVVPSHNHARVIRSVIESLRKAKLPVFVIDDGSLEPFRSQLAALHDPANEVYVSRLSANEGKGAAVLKGFQLATESGFTHVLQIDADGQHDLKAVPEILRLASAYPEALISGRPIYDHTVPKSRKYGRMITHFWVWVETLSFRIQDSMCGFRVYPLKAVNSLIAAEPIGRHMEFDMDIMVRLFWRGVAPVMMPIRVIYPPDNTSNFDLLRDNLRITKTHIWLCLQMLWRAPWLLLNRPPPTREVVPWSGLRERGTYWALRLALFLFRTLGQTVCRLFLLPVVAYFFLTGSVQRKSIHAFLAHALGRPPTIRETFRPFMNFTDRALDVLAAWMAPSATPVSYPAGTAEFQSVLAGPTGGLLVISHLGNVDMMRAWMSDATRARVTILLHTRHSENYNRLIKDCAFASDVNLFQVTELGPETIMLLKQRVEEGGWIVIAGDRTSVSNDKHEAHVPFFGADAGFPHGPWIIGALLDCPVYLLFCLREGKDYRVTMELFSEKLSLPRKGRQERLRQYVIQYAARLQFFAAKAPFQWYNFFDFWAPKK